MPPCPGFAASLPVEVAEGEEDGVDLVLDDVDADDAGVGAVGDAAGGGGRLVGEGPEVRVEAHEGAFELAEREAREGSADGGLDEFEGLSVAGEPCGLAGGGESLDGVGGVASAEFDLDRKSVV